MRKNLLTGVVAAVVLVFVLSLAVGCGSAGTLPTGVVAKIGQTDITQQQLDQELTLFKAIYAGHVPDEKADPSQYKDFEIYVLDQLVNYEVVKAKASSLNISVADKDIQDYLDKIKTNTFGGDQSKFDAALKSSNLTLDQLKTYYGQLILVQKAYEEVTKNVPGASDAEISAYYDAHKSSFYQNETRAVRHILITPSGSSPQTATSASTTTTASDSQWAAALATAQKVRADLVGGADWTTEAAKYSDDPGSKANGGALGTISKGQTVTEFDQAAFSLAQGDISQPVKTVYGYHIIQVTAINPAKQQTLDEARSTIASNLLGQKKMTTFNAWVKKARAELNVLVTPGLQTTTTTVSKTTTTAAGPNATTGSPSVTSAPATDSAQPSTTGTTAGVGPTAGVGTTVKP